MASNSISVKPIAGSLGAEIEGIDLCEDLHDDTVHDLRRALLDHKVIFIRDQKITPEEQIRFARRFGEAAEYPFVKGLDAYPEIIEVRKEAHEKVNFGGLWHSDTTYLEEPPMATMLYALELPPYGGDTLFANMVQAYETLSDGMKAMLDGLIGINRSDNASVTATRLDRLKDAGKEDAKPSFVAEHPLVRTHPETGRKCLYLSAAHTAQIKGMTVEESAAILSYLFVHQVRPEFTCRFRWSAGALAFWDNRQAMHNPINDYHGQRRVLHRITLAGDKPH